MPGIEAKNIDKKINPSEPISIYKKLDSGANRTLSQIIPLMELIRLGKITDDDLLCLSAEITDEEQALLTELLEYANLCKAQQEKIKELEDKLKSR